MKSQDTGERRRSIVPRLVARNPDAQRRVHATLRLTTDALEKNYDVRGGSRTPTPIKALDPKSHVLRIANALLFTVLHCVRFAVRTDCAQQFIDFRNKCPLRLIHFLPRQASLKLEKNSSSDISREGVSFVGNSVGVFVFVGNTDDPAIA